MKSLVVLFMCLCVCIFECWGARGARLEAQTAQAPASSKLTTSLSMHGNQFTVGQDMPVTLTIKDISNQNIPLRTAPHYYHVYVEGAKGEVDKTRFYHRLRGELLPGESELRGGGVTFELKPSETGTKDFDLAKYYKLQEPGEYRAYIECDDESGRWVRSNTISFELKAPN